MPAVIPTLSKAFQIQQSDMDFLLQQVTFKSLRLKGYASDGTPLYGYDAQESPHLSDRSKNVGEEWLVPQHLGEALHQRAQPIITHCGQ